MLFSTSDLIHSVRNDSDFAKLSVNEVGHNLSQDGDDVLKQMDYDCFFSSGQ